LLCAGVAVSSTARAEKTLVKTDKYEVFTDGRAGGFVSWVFGDGRPPPSRVVGTDAQGQPAVQSTWNILGGELEAPEETKLSDDPVLAKAGVEQQGRINMMRLRSGFVGNTLGLGVRSPLNDRVTATAYLQIWTFVESPTRNIALPNPADLKQGYAMVDGPFGKVLAGKARALFSRGATDIDAKYAHGYSVGFPAALDSNGPTRGMIGFGVMGSGWGGTVQYATPELAGFQLTAGIFDPIQNQAARFSRTKWARPEAELRYKLEFGQNGLVEAFVNGAYQKLYRDGYCSTTPVANPADPANPTTPLCEITAFGVGYGARAEVGPVRLGLAGHFGDGLGLGRALEVSTASTDLSDHVRRFDGYYAQSMLVLGNVDVFAGAGIVRVFLTDDDKSRRIPDPLNAGRTIPSQSLIKDQIGINAGAVYHWGESLHFAVDYFRAQLDWYLGEKQVLHSFSGGMTVTW
jgi:hypothetical protein